MSQRLLDFVTAVACMAGRAGLSQSEALDEAARYMVALVAQDDWLPPAMAVSDSRHYQQHLLYGDPLDRFSLVSFVWGPGQFTPVHDHTVWGVIGVLRGAEREIPYERTADGKIRPSGPTRVLRSGDVALVAPGLDDIHAVSNAQENLASISIHLYGGNIGRIQRHVYDVQTGQTKPFVSGYSNTLVPNLWAAQS